MLGGLCLALAFLAGRTSTPAVAAVAPRPEESDLVRSLDRLESALTESRGVVTLNEELGRRHERVSAIACQGVEAHARDSARIVADHKRRKVRHQDEDVTERVLSSASVQPASLNGRRLAAAPAVARPPATHSP